MLLLACIIRGQNRGFLKRRVSQGKGNTYLVEVDVHALELELGRASIDTIAVEAVLARDGLPKGGTDLVTLSKKCELLAAVSLKGGRWRDFNLRTGRSGCEPVYQKESTISKRTSLEHHDTPQSRWIAALKNTNVFV